MTVILSEDFTGYAAGTEVQNISGWAVYAEFPSQRSAPKVNSSGQLYSTTTDTSMCYYNTGNLSNYSKVKFLYQFSGSFIKGGPAVRVIDRYTWITIELRSLTTTAIIYRYPGISASDLVVYPIGIVIGDTVELQVDDATNTIEMFVNGVSAGAPLSIASISTPTTNAGIAVFGARDPLYDYVELGTKYDDIITINPNLDRKVFAVIGDSRPHTISGTYESPTIPTFIDCKVEEYVSGSTVLDWTELDGSPSGGLYSGVLNFPPGPFYKIRTRFRNAPSISTESARIGFGEVIALEGQSNTFNITGSGYAVTANDNVVFFDGANYVVPTSGAIVEGLNKIAVSNNRCVAYYTTAVSATSISQHLPPMGTNYDNRVAALIAVGGKLTGTWWGQGESGESEAYYASLGILYEDILDRTGQDGPTCPLFIVQLGRDVGGSGNWQDTRNAQTSYAYDNANAYISHQTIDLPMTDELHRNSSGLVMEAERFGDSYNNYKGVISYNGRGPIPTSATYTGNTLTMTYSLNGSTGLVVPSGAENLFELTNDNFSTIVKPVSVSYTSPNKIVMTFSSIPASSDKIRSHQGQDFTLSTLPTGDLQYNTQNVMVEPINIALPVTEVVGNSPPIADGGSEQSVEAGAEFVLNFTGSYDIDGTISSYNITQTEGDSVTLTGSGDIRTGTAPSTDAGQQLIFSLTVTDNEGAVSSPSLLIVNVAAVVVEQSTATITILGIVDGDYPIKLWSETTNLLLYNGDVTFSSNQASVLIDAPVETDFSGRWLGSNPPSTGTGLYGTTE